MGFLNGWGHQRGAVHGIKLPRVGVLGRRPQALHHANGFLEAGLTLIAVQVITVVFIASAAPPKANIEAAAAGQIQHGRILGQAYGVVQGRHEDRGTEADRARAGGDVGRQDEGGRPETIARKVVLRKPGNMKPDIFAVLYLLRDLTHVPEQIYALWPGVVTERRTLPPAPYY